MKGHLNMEYFMNSMSRFPENHNGKKKNNGDNKKSSCRSDNTFN